MSEEYEIEVDFYSLTADEAECQDKVWIVFEYTPEEPGRAPDAYQGGEQSYPSSVEILRVEYREPGKPAVELPAFIVAGIFDCEHIENMMIEHVEGGL